MNGKGFDREGTLTSFYLDGRPGGGFAAPESRTGYVAPEGRPGGGFVGTEGGLAAPEGRPGGNLAPSGGYTAPEGRPGGGVYGTTEGRPTGSHSLQVINREQVMVSGVTAVDAFDEEEILLETELGGLTLRGEELQIRQLDLESGKFAVEGYITSLIYTAPRQGGRRSPKGRSFLERLLK